MFCEEKGKMCYAESDLEFLVNISNIISLSEDLYKNLKVLLKELCQFMPAQYSVIAIVDPNQDKIMISTAYGLTKEEQKRGTYKVGEGVIGKVVETGKPVCISDITEESNFLNRTEIKYSKGDTVAFLCVPIILKAEILGTLSVHIVHHYDIDFAHKMKLLHVVSLLIGKNLSIHRKHIEALEELRKENTRLKSDKPKKPDNIIGNSSLMHDLYQQIERVSPTNSTVIIRGESGVGKELIAEAIHKASSRASKPFIKVNCSALPENLIESELFGHEKGSFTGANTSHIGRFEMANGGTIFLDEIGDVPLSIQVKLLRVLQERQIDRIGGTKTIDMDVRIITATNRNLEEMIKENTFREDFYYRINVFSIYVPALRERKADISVLTDHFIAKLNKYNCMNILRITSTALDMLMVYHWPGNIRELENAIERAAILSTDDVIHSYHLPPSLQTAVSSNTRSSGTLESALAQVEKQMIIDALIANNGNSAKSAVQLGITERIIGLRIKHYGLKPQSYKIQSNESN
ncbi:Nif-specific regulatory protein [Bacteroidales bacterium Barb6]|nr:Nif-specific regulatory protein [Bacteroidales bacterium Barb4]OAV73087.1 Nif-specific regulatory protein [Bacteroidales bacterium Barb6]OAV74321.1 Nif-specific regulatory protein [Bacteroidales bacterium Barb7]